MNTFLLNRALGSVSHQSLARAQSDRLVHSIQLANRIKLSYNGSDGISGVNTKDGSTKVPVAHPAGVNTITVDRFEGR